MFKFRALLNIFLHVVFRRQWCISTAHIYYMKRHTFSVNRHVMRKNAISLVSGGILVLSKSSFFRTPPQKYVNSSINITSECKPFLTLEVGQPFVKKKTTHTFNNKIVNKLLHRQLAQCQRYVALSFSPSPVIVVLCY